MVNGPGTRGNKQASFAYALTYRSDYFQFIKWKCTIDRLIFCNDNFSKPNSATFT